MNANRKNKPSYIRGYWPVVEAIKSGKDLEKVYFKQGYKSKKLSEVRAMLKNTSVPIQYVPARKFKKMAAGKNKGIIAQAAAIRYYSVEDILMQAFEQGRTPFLLILDKVTDVRNLGAIARSAEAMNADALIVPSKGSAMINQDALEASAGALHHIPVCRIKKFNATLKYLKESGVQVIAALETGDRPISSVDFKQPTAVVLGAEGKGIPPEHLEQVEQQAHIPLKGQVNALNVSVAAGIVLYECLKQRID